jgi:hypothetical protein
LKWASVIFYVSNDLLRECSHWCTKYHIPIEDSSLLGCYTLSLSPRALCSTYSPTLPQDQFPGVSILSYFAQASFAISVTIYQLTATYPRRLEFSATPLSQPQTLHHIYIDFTWYTGALQFPYPVMVHKEKEMDGTLSSHSELWNWQSLVTRL